MKFIPSATYSKIANLAGKQVSYDAYARSVTSVNESVTGNSPVWIDLSQRLQPFDSISLSIEYELGKFNADSNSFICKNIEWMSDNIFTDTEINSTTSWVEVKLTATLSDGVTSTTNDNCVLFSGFVDKTSIQENELDDSVSFDVLSFETILDWIDAGEVNTQYINTSITGTMSGVVVSRVPGLWITSISGLNYGNHSLSYKGEFLYTTGSAGSTTAAHVSLDGGEPVTIVHPNSGVSWSGSITVQTPEQAGNVKLFWKESELNNRIERTSNFWVDSITNVSPRNYYEDSTVLAMFNNLYGRAGLSGNLVTDTFTIPTWEGTNSISFLGIPPTNAGITGIRAATCSGASTDHLYVGMGNSIFRRSISSHNYVSITSLPASHVINKLMYNARTNHLWSYSSSGARIVVNRINLSANNQISSSMYLTGATSYGTFLNDMFNGTSYNYGIFWGDSTTFNSYFIDGQTVTAGTVSLGANNAGLMAYPLGTAIYYETAAKFIRRLSVAADDIWSYTDSANLYGPLAQTLFKGTYAPDTNVYGESFAGGCVKYATTGGSPGVLSNVGDTPNEIVAGTISAYVLSQNNTLYSIFSGTTALIGSISSVFGSQQNGIKTMTEVGGVLYGLDNRGGVVPDWYGRLFAVDDTITLWMDDSLYAGQTLRAFINKICAAYNLIVTVNAEKKIFIYKRSDSTGQPITSGNTLTANVSNSTSLSRRYLYALYDTVHISNDTDSILYDGSSYSTKVDRPSKRISFKEAFIPTDILKDLVSVFYNFFRTTRHMYSLNVQSPLFQFEPIDNCNFDFSSNYISKQISGDGYPIYAISYNWDGSVTIKVLA